MINKWEKVEYETYEYICFKSHIPTFKKHLEDYNSYHWWWQTRILHGLDSLVNQASPPVLSGLIVYSDRENKDPGPWRSKVAAGRGSTSVWPQVHSSPRYYHLDTSLGNFDPAPFKEKWKEFKWEVEPESGRDVALCVSVGQRVFGIRLKNPGNDPAQEHWLGCVLWAGSRCPRQAFLRKPLDSEISR